MPERPLVIGESARPYVNSTEESGGNEVEKS